MEELDRFSNAWGDLLSFPVPGMAKKLMGYGLLGGEGSVLWLTL